MPAGTFSRQGSKMMFNAKGDGTSKGAPSKSSMVGMMKDGGASADDMAEFMRMMDEPLTAENAKKMRAMMKAAGISSDDIDAFMQMMKAK